MALIQGDELGFSPFKALVKVANPLTAIKLVGKPLGGVATSAGNVVGGPWGAALKIGGGVLTQGAGALNKKAAAAAPPPPCTFGQKVKRFFGGKPDCT